MLRILIFLFVMHVGYARVDMTQHDMEILKKHPMIVQNVTAEELQWIITEEWMSLVKYCDDLDPGARISANFDQSLIGTNTLAWASSTLILQNGIWIPSISKKNYPGYDFLIGVNPEPINGWHISTDCSDIGYRYDLRTVMRHEMIHGVGIGSSMTYNNGGISVGHTFNGQCYPRIYDSMIEDADGNKVVDGCTVGNIEGKKLYLNNVQLFNPVTFSTGSSISHHIYPNELMFWLLPAGKCADISTNELKMLSAVGVHCPGHPLYSAAADRAYPSLFLIPVMLLLFLI